LLTGDKWSQMINLMYGPDGQVWMIDWYDANQCHRPEEGAHDRTNGRIYRVAYNNAKPVKVDLAKLSDLELVKLLSNPNEWYRRHATRLLQERRKASAADVADGVKQAFENQLQSKDDTLRLRALWAAYLHLGAL